MQEAPVDFVEALLDVDRRPPKRHTISTLALDPDAGGIPSVIGANAWSAGVHAGKIPSLHPRTQVSKA